MAARSLWYQQSPADLSNTEHYHQSLNLDLCDIFMKDKIDSLS